MEPSRYIKIDVKLSKRDRQSIERLLEGKFKVLTDAKLFVKVENKK